MKLLRRNYIGCEGRTNGQTDIYYIPPLSSGVITVSAVANSMYTGSFFLLRRDQREKRYFYKVCRFFFKFIFDRIFIPPPKKDGCI